MQIGELPRFVRTILHVPPRQLVSRVTSQLRRAIDARRGPDSAPTPVSPGWPETFVPVDSRLPQPDTAEISDGRPPILGHAFDLGPPAQWRWSDSQRPRLWNFHLNYWDWAYGIAEQNPPSTLMALWEGWAQRTHYAVGDQWEPYVVSLRLWTMCGLFEAVKDTRIGPQYLHFIALQDRYLRRHLEADIRGNHLIKNIKALFGTSVFLDQSADYALQQFVAEVERQVLDDGGHEERSPSYHVQVLLDVLDVLNLATLTDQAFRHLHALSQITQRMSHWLEAIIISDNAPLLNDGFPVPRSVLTLLRDIGLLQYRDRPSAGTHALIPSGYLRINIGDFEHLLDTGPIGPNYNPGHGHADTLSYITNWRKQPIFVDTGTSTYDVGVRRDFERSTAAHNTVQVNDINSSEVWSAFRVGRRASAELMFVDATADAVLAGARHDGYQHLQGRPTHERTWNATQYDLTIHDRIIDQHTNRAASYFHVDSDAPLLWHGRTFTGSAAPYLTLTVTTDTGVELRPDIETYTRAISWKQTAMAFRLRYIWPTGVNSLWTVIRVETTTNA